MAAVSGPLATYYATNRIDGYFLGNARLTWKQEGDSPFSVGLEVQNLFNKYYTPFRFAAVYGFSGTIYSQVGRPREWAVTVKKTF